MAPSHFLQIVADGTVSGGERERFLDLARHPLLTMNQEPELLRKRSGCRNLSCKRPDSLGGNAARGPNELFKFVCCRILVFARSDEKALQLVIFDSRGEAVECNHTGPFGLQQEIQNVLEDRLHVVKLPVTGGLRKANPACRWVEMVAMTRHLGFQSSPRNCRRREATWPTFPKGASSSRCARPRSAVTCECSHRLDLAKRQDEVQSFLGYALPLAVHGDDMEAFIQSD